jgi:hypothetical protein
MNQFKPLKFDHVDFEENKIYAKFGGKKPRPSEEDIDLATQLILERKRLATEARQLRDKIAAMEDERQAKRKEIRNLHNRKIAEKFDYMSVDFVEKISAKL